MHDAEVIITRALLDNPSITDQLDVSAGDFESSRLRAVWETAYRLQAAEELVIPANLVNQYVPAEYLAELLAGTAPTLAEAHWAAKALREAARFRKLERAVKEAGFRLKESKDRPIDAVVEEVESLVFDACSDSAPSLTEISAVVISVLESLKTRKDDKNRAVKFGLAELDRQTGGMMPGDLIVVGARTGIGKSIFATEVLRRCKVPSLIFSLEMSKEELAERLLSRDGEVGSLRIRSGDLYQSDWDSMAVAAKAISLRKPIYVDDRSMLSMAEISHVARKAVRRNGVRLVVVDYLQLIKTQDDLGMEREIAAISVGLKRLAKQLQVPVMAIGQLNREPVRRKPPRPQLQDFRGSDAIAHESNMAILLWRPELHDEKERQGIIELIVDKNRAGPLGTMEFRFLGQYVGIDDLEGSNADFRDRD